MSWKQTPYFLNYSPEDLVSEQHKKRPIRLINDAALGHLPKFDFCSTKQLTRNLSSHVLRTSVEQSKSPIHFRSPNHGGKTSLSIRAKPRELLKDMTLDFGFKQQAPKPRKKLNNKEQVKFSEELTKFPVFNIAKLKVPSQQPVDKECSQVHRKMDKNLNFSENSTSYQIQQQISKAKAGQAAQLDSRMQLDSRIQGDSKQQISKSLAKMDLMNFPTVNPRKTNDPISNYQNVAFLKKQNKMAEQNCFPFQRMLPVNERYEAPKKGDFDIGKTLGKGQYGEVMVVRHKKTGFVCAMKVMSKKVIKQQNYINQIVRELSIQFYLRHRNIAPLYGYFSDEENVYLLVEFCQGGQLYNKIKKQKRLSEKQTSEITKQILQGLDYIHKQQIIHRDLKPENILFASGVVKISDFGWAVFSNAGLRRTVSGSPLYYPPQIVKGEQYDQKIDIWNVGMMVYECLLGKIPFRIYSELDLDKIVSDQITFPDYIDVSEVAKDFILKTMRKNPEERMELREMIRHRFIKQYDSKVEGAQLEQELAGLL